MNLQISTPVETGRAPRAQTVDVPPCPSPSTDFFLSKNARRMERVGRGSEEMDSVMEQEIWTISHLRALGGPGIKRILIDPGFDPEELKFELRDSLKGSALNTVRAASNI